MKRAERRKNERRKKPSDTLVFDYKHLPYGKYAVIQIVAFSLGIPAAGIWYQFFSKWRGPTGFIYQPSAWMPALGIVLALWLLATFAPIRDFLTVRNERIEIKGDVVRFYNMWNRKKFEAKVGDIQMLRAGVAITSKVKRYVFKSGKQSFFFSADIGDVERLLRLLGVNGQPAKPVS